MSRKISASRALVVDVFKRFMAEIDNPTPLVIPDEDLALDDLDGLFTLFMGEPAPATERAPTAVTPEPVCGTKPISIRLHNRVINAFKAEATKTGTSYQRLMHRALADAAEEFVL